MATTKLATGKPRTLGGGRKPWRVALSAPTSSYSRYRVTFKEPDKETGTWSWTSRTADEHSEESARALFAKTERWLDGLSDHAPARQRVKAERTISALGQLMLDQNSKKLEERTVEQRESHLNAHILPTIGDVSVDKWRLSHSEMVMEKAAKTCGVARLGDIRTTLSVMRGIAHREGWLSPEFNPLEGLETAKQQEYHGAGKGYVDPSLRPETRMVDAMAAAAEKLVADGYQSFARLPYLGTKYRVAGYGGLRSGEQNALRAWDVYFDEGWVFVTGSWTQPRRDKKPAFRGPVKNKRPHEVPLPASLMEELYPVVRDALGLPVGATMQQVLNAQRAERLRRGKLVQSPDRWWEVQVDPADEAWLFVDTTTGLPVRSELHNDYWHKVRRWVSKNDPDNEWPVSITYRNMRHHAATFWHDELGHDWPDVALFLGDELTTVLNHYVRAGADVLKRAVKNLRDY
ncbi:hypothetical protein [Nocardioides caricicola]|uniref:Integrase n=1 Tax=Nocardioides caricicola TaxID=634770 RepID=A0ABW0N3X3_9ACTN